MKYTVDVLLTRKEWQSSYKKWCDIVDALEAGDLSRMRRALSRVCAYCTAFGRAVRSIDIPSTHDHLETLDNCWGCSLSEAKVCINDYHEQLNRFKVAGGYAEESTRPYWKIKDTLGRLARHEIKKEDKQNAIDGMIVCARLIREAIKRDEKNTVEGRK